MEKKVNKLDIKKVELSEWGVVMIFLVVIAVASMAMSWWMNTGLGEKKVEQVSSPPVVTRETMADNGDYVYESHQLAEELRNKGMMSEELEKYVNGHDVLSFRVYLSHVEEIFEELLGGSMLDINAEAEAWNIIFEQLNMRMIALHEAHTRGLYPDSDFVYSYDNYLTVKKILSSVYYIDTLELRVGNGSDVTAGQAGELLISLTAKFNKNLSDEELAQQLSLFANQNNMVTTGLSVSRSSNRVSIESSDGYEMLLPSLGVRSVGDWSRIVQLDLKNGNKVYVIGLIRQIEEDMSIYENFLTQVKSNM
jgi:hypothetical protein